MAGNIYPIGACETTFKSVALGKTFGGVTMTINDDVQLITADLTGTTPVDGYYKGTDVKVRVPVLEPSWAELVAVYPQLMTLVATDDYVQIDNPVGQMMSDVSGTLQLDPIQNVNAAAPDDDNTINFDSAAPVSVTEAVYDNENQRVFTIEFQCLANATTGSLGQFGVDDS